MRPSLFLCAFGVGAWLAFPSPPACADHDGHHRGPPPEAIEACRSLAADDACTVTLRDGVARAGTCTSHPDGDGTLACRPKDMPAPPGR